MKGKVNTANIFHTQEIISDTSIINFNLGFAKERERNMKNKELNLRISEHMVPNVSINRALLKITKNVLDCVLTIQ